MNDYIKVPEWTYINRICSEAVEKFLKNVRYIGDKKIDIQSLREYYKSNQNNFSNLVHELSLRGFEFFSSKENNILPQNSYNKYEEYIFSDNNLDKYKKINFENFQIKNFILRFDVKNDDFFNYIPINGFKVMNPNVNIEDIKVEFLSKGFKVSKNIGYSYKKRLDNPIDITKKIQNKKSISNNDTVIDMCFTGRKYEIFRRICKSNNITYINEITPEIMEIFSKQSGVGISKFNDVKEKILKFNLELGNKQQKETYSEYLDNMSLEKIFTKRIYEVLKIFCYNYNSFMDFCDKFQVYSIDDIKTYIVDKFSNLEWVKKYKIYNHDAITEVRKSVKEAKNKNKEVLINIDPDIYNKIKNHTISEILGKCGYEYIDSNFKISEIQGKKSSEIIDDKSIVDISQFYRCIKFLNKMELPKDILNKLKNDLGERKNLILICRFQEGLTLNETGEIIGVTRERIRQIEAQSLRKIRQYLKINHFHKILRVFLPNQGFFNKKDLVKLFGEKNMHFMNIIIQNNMSKTFYFKPLDIVYFKDYQTNIDNLKKLINMLPEVFNIDDYIDDVEESFRDLCVYIKMEKVAALLEYYDYKKYGNYFSKKTLSKLDVMEIIFKDYINKPLKIDEKGLKLIRDIAQNVFSYEIIDSYRAIDARLRDSEKIILVDKKTFCHINNINYDQAIIKLAEEYIDGEFEKRSVINIEEVFLKLENMCKKNNIKDKRELYSLVRLNLEDKYEIGKGNTLNIFRGDVKEKYNREDKLIIYLKQTNGIALKKDIISSLRWKSFKLDDTVSKSNKLISWGDKKIALLDNIKIDEPIKFKLRNIVDECMLEGFSTSSFIYKKMMLNDDLNKFLRTNNIDESMKIASIIRGLFKDIKGHINFLYKVGSKYHSITEVVEGKFTDVTYREEIKNFIISYGYKEVMALNIIKNLIQEKKYIEISQDELVLYNKLNFSQRTINLVSKEILDRMNGKVYISLSNIKGYRRKLPEIEYRWNPYLIKSILDGNKFRAINKIYRDYRYDKVIVVDEKSEIYTFEDLIYYILKNEYKGNLHEIKVYDYLSSIGVLRYEKEIYSKKLPYEIYNSKKINIDDLGRIELVEE
ncbi:hypothetical protein Z957_09585 [Clostridium sp. K25]|uniref:sigma factor-like helix-turn-helix DNA-binding protein n=1 Tax=Clostridium sp. K25 TaxID=1443109 RepID=UPI0004D6A368|nr:sigma factor-like helix-turn-helix DNA-binding protein [Clostridium sp. K25]KEI07167.1 hypothetical protein Z957_09585 [Clostridium sp. K25]